MRHPVTHRNPSSLLHNGLFEQKTEGTTGATTHSANRRKIKTMYCTAVETEGVLWLQQEHKDTYQGCSSTAMANGRLFFLLLSSSHSNPPLNTPSSPPKLWSQHSVVNYLAQAKGTVRRFCSLLSISLSTSRASQRLHLA